MSRVETNPLIALPIPTFTSDAEGRVLVWNDAAAELTGRASREVVGQKSWKGFSNRRTTTPLDAALTAGEHSSAPYRFVSAGGEEVDVTFSVRVRLREDGEPDGATVCLLPANQAKMPVGALVADHAASAMMLVDNRFEVQWANAAAKELFAKHAAAIQADWPRFSAEDLVGADVGPVLGDHRKTLGDVKAAQTVHVTLGRALCRVSSNPVRDERGALAGIALEWHDVTAAKAAEDRGAVMSSFVEGAMACVMMCDNDRRITYLNPSVRKMLSKYAPIIAKRFPAFNLDNLIGNSVDIFHVDPGKQARMFTDRSIHPYKSEIVVNGLEFTLNLTALYDAAGNQIGSAVEWFDQNARAAYRKEVQALYAAATQGDLTRRGDVSQMDDTYRPMLQSINEIVEAILAPVNEIQGSLGRLAEGDLRAYIAGDYQGDHGRLKQAMNGTLDALNEILGQVRTAADQIASGSAQVASSAQSLSGGATEQAAAVEQITASIGEMTDQTRGNAESATQARQLASEAGNLAETGDERMRAMVKAMADIDESSQSISKIIKVIDEIAFQTNLLALNAAVEAARAGVHGKGFAVVAEEVRNLAARSANAAKETTAMIEGSIKKVAHGTQIAEDTAQALSRIVASVGKVKDLVAEIAAASNEQAQGIAQVDQGLKQVDQVTQQNTAGAEESASAAEQLSAQAARLKELVARFKLREAEQQTMPEITPELLAALQAYLRAQGGNLSLPGMAPAPGGAPRTAGPSPRPSQPAYTNGQGHAPSGPHNGPRGAAGTFVALTDDEFGRY